MELVLGVERRAMTTADGETFEVALELAPGTRYGFSLDGGEPLPDPRSRWQPDGVHGPSAAWRGSTEPGGWRGRDLPSSVLYELHVGTFTPEGTFDGAIGGLDHLVALGVDAVSLMPVAEFPGAHGWGYDGVGLYAPHHSYGGPAGLDRFVAACHQRGIAVVIDVVYNHVGPDGNHLARFGPYFTDRHRTPWGEAVNFDGLGSSHVREFVIDNTLAWMTEHGVDGVRLDAVHAIFDASATHVIERLTARVDELSRATGRALWVIAESDLNDPRVVRERERWGWGCDAQWSDDLHHALHALLTGERTGYYGDFGQVADLAKALRDVFVYDGRASAYRRRIHGRPVGDLGGKRFLAYTQSHDQVGNRARGERLSQLVGPGRLRIAAAVVMLSPYVPMLFMGEEWGATSPFLYFTDHTDPELGRAVTEGRRREYTAFGWRPEDIVDPQSREAFERSRLDWSEPGREPHRALLEWYRALIALRREVPELRDGRRDLAEIAFDESARWLRMSRGPITLALALERGAEVPVPEGDLVLASDPAIRSGRGTLTLPPDSVAVLRR